MVKTVNREELQALMSNGAEPVLIEALPQKYYDEGHLPGARHLPLDQVGSRAGEVAPNKSVPVVVYCASDSCRSSSEAASQLSELGYSDVSVYPGGKKDWEEAGLAFEK